MTPIDGRSMREVGRPFDLIGTDECVSAVEVHKLIEKGGSSTWYNRDLAFELVREHIMRIPSDGRFAMNHIFVVSCAVVRIVFSDESDAVAFNMMCSHALIDSRHPMYSIPLSDW